MTGDLQEIKIILLSPEVLKRNEVIKSLMDVRSSIILKCVDEAHLFYSWGIEKQKGETFRPAMQLSTGELASLGGITLLQTATASCRTMRMLVGEFPEISSWKKILDVPYRSNVTIVVPPPSTIPSRYQEVLAPFIRRILDFQEPHLIIARSINSGTEIYFFLLRMLGTTYEDKSVAFYHRHSSEKRKKEILHDLSLPLDSPSKKLKAVVATISLGVGVDIRVKNVVCMGLGSSPESMVQEAGRCVRGSKQSTDKDRGYAFFFQKGTISAIHCPPSSDCRALISEPLPKCQTRCLFSYFDPQFEVNGFPCNCCYRCIVRDSENGCDNCTLFLETYLPRKVSHLRCSSVRKGLKSAIMELFRGLGISSIDIETRLSLNIENFANDFVKVYDEIDSPSSIQSLWHVSEELARDLYEVSLEFINSNTVEDNNVNEDIDEIMTDNEERSDHSRDREFMSESSSDISSLSEESEVSSSDSDI